VNEKLDYMTLLLQLMFGTFVALGVINIYASARANYVLVILGDSIMSGLNRSLRGIDDITWGLGTVFNYLDGFWNEWFSVRSSNRGAGNYYYDSSTREDAHYYHQHHGEPSSHQQDISSSLFGIVFNGPALLLPSVVMSCSEALLHARFWNDVAILVDSSRLVKNMIVVMMPLLPPAVDDDQTPNVPLLPPPDAAFDGDLLQQEDQDAPATTPTSETAGEAEIEVEVPKRNRRGCRGKRGGKRVREKEAKKLQREGQMIMGEDEEQRKREDETC